MFPCLEPLSGRITGSSAQVGDLISLSGLCARRCLRMIAADVHERCTANDRCEPHGSDDMLSKRGPSLPEVAWSRPVVDAIGAPVLCDQGPIGPPDTVMPIPA